MPDPTSLEQFVAAIAATGHALDWQDDADAREFRLWLGEVLLLRAPVNVAGERPAAEEPVHREDAPVLAYLLREALG